MITTGVLRKAMHEIAAQKGEFTLFSLLKRPDALGKWDLVVAAPWLETGRFEALEKFVDLLARSIGKKLLSQLARVEIVPSDNKTVKSVWDIVPIDEDGEGRIRNTRLFGLELEEAVILHVGQPSSKRATRKVLHSNGAQSRKAS